MNAYEKHNIIAGLYGNTLEWYDFLLFASFAPIFANIFFPSHNYFASLMATFGIFAIGFLVRPIGGALLGHYGDYIGRRKALIISISIMSLSTLFIAFLPTFNNIGILSPLLFTLFRIIQGLAVGGELPSSTIFLIEHMPANRRGLAGSLALSTAFLGIFAGALTATILTTYFQGETMVQWGWRIAYIIGGVLGFLGIYLRLKSSEPAHYLRAEKTIELPAKLVFTTYPKQLLLAISFTSILALSNYILIAYATTYLVNFENFSLHNATVINFIALLTLTLLIPLMGLLSDYIGRKTVLLLGLVSLLIFTFPIFWLLTLGHFGYALLGELILSVVLAFINGSVPTIIAELFPTQIRSSGSSIGYNIGQALFGGTVPLVAFALIHATDNQLAPAWYTLICTIVVFFTSFFLHETYKKPLA